MRDGKSGLVEIGISGQVAFSAAMRNLPYREVYEALVASRQFNVRMLDGALLQLNYRFIDAELMEHRLAFFPSPDLERFQSDPEIYLIDEVYAEIVKLGVVPFPVRFDFNSDPNVVRELDHPASHLTLGQYLNCRIPVSAPVTPFHFIAFVLRNFYHSAYVKCAEEITTFGGQCFVPTIADSERGVVHVFIPGS